MPAQEVYKMAKFFNRIRSGAGRAAFEADKLRRVNSVQSIIKSLQEEINQTFFRAGRVAFELHQAGQVAQPELQQVCGHLTMLHGQVIARGHEIEAIRDQEYVEPRREPQYGRLCPNGHGELPPQAKFCPVCGAQAVSAPPPAATSKFCPACGTELLPEARFCPGCGAAVPRPSPAPAAPPPVPEPEAPPVPAVEPSLPVTPAIEPLPPAAQGFPLPPPPALEPLHCPNCGSSLVPEAIFCPRCGEDVASITGAAPGATA